MLLERWQPAIAAHSMKLSSAAVEPNKPASTTTTNNARHHAAGATVSRLRLSKEVLPEYGPSFERLTVEATPETPTRLHIKVFPTDSKRWEVPESIVPR